MDRDFTPVFAAIPSNFAILHYDDEDIKFGVDAVNGKYDYLQFCRIVSWTDCAINLPVLVSATMNFLFPCMPGLEISDVVEKSNLACFNLLFGGIYLGVVKHANVGYASVYETGYYLLLDLDKGSSYNFIFQLQQYGAGDLERSVLLHPKLISESQFKSSMKKGCSISKKLEFLSPTIMLEAIESLKTENYVQSSVYFWSIIEAFIDYFWTKEVLPIGSGIEGRSKMISGNMWTAAHKIEVFFQRKIIDEKIYELLNKVRKRRNKVLHRLENAERQICIDSLTLVIYFISKVVGDFDYINSILFSLIKEQHVSEQFKIEIGDVWRTLNSVPGGQGWKEKDPNYRTIKLSYSIKDVDLK